MCVCKYVCVLLTVLKETLKTPQKNPECPQLPKRHGLAILDYLPCHTPVISHTLKEKHKHNRLVSLTTNEKFI